jgi:hypothetical protein
LENVHWYAGKGLRCRCHCVGSTRVRRGSRGRRRWAVPSLYVLVQT